MDGPRRRIFLYNYKKMIRNRYTYNSFNYQYTYINSKAYISLLQIHYSSIFLNLCSRYTTIMGPKLKFLVGSTMKLTRVGIKLGIAGGALYGVNYYGLNGSSDQASEGISAIKKDCPMTAALAKAKLTEYNIPVPELPELNLSEVVPTLPEFQSGDRGVWNHFVIVAIQGLVKLPAVIDEIPNTIKEGSLSIVNSITASDEKPAGTSEKSTEE